MKEHQHIEWKESWRDDGLRSICGFANADGGVLVIGRNDGGKVAGIENGSRLLEELPNKVRDLLGIMVDVNLRIEGGREFLEITVPAYPNPISYKGEYYYRSGSTNQTLKGAALDRFLLRRQGRHWDGVPAPGFSVADLSASALAGFRKRVARSKRLSPELLAETDAVLLDKLRLFEKTYLKRAAVMLFHDEPDRLVTGASVKIGFFRTDSDLLYHDEIHGDLFTQVDRTLDLLLTKYLRAWISYEGIQRLETYPIPEAALREAVINAIVHKDYASGIPVQISVYDHKLMIWNPGQLPPDWTLDQLTAKHASVPYNPDIASVFFRAALLESWGRGIDLIRDACVAHGSPPPTFRWDNGLWTEFPFMAVVREAIDPVTGQVTGQVTGEVAGEVTGQVTAERKREKTRKTSGKTSGETSGKTSRKTSELESRLESGLKSGLKSGLESGLESRLGSRLGSRLAGQVLLLLRDAEMGRSGIAAALGHATVSGGLHKQIRRLVAAEFIAVTIPDKPNSRLQKYRLTQQGVLLIETFQTEAGPP